MNKAHSEFDAPWSYLVALKDYKLRSNWYREAPELDIQLQKRILKTESGEPALKRFDAPTMIEYQVPPKTFEVNYCRQHNDHWECKDSFFLFDKCVKNVSQEELQIRQSLISESAGRGLFASTDIPVNSCLLINDGPKSFQVLPSTWSVIDGMHESFSDEPDMTEKLRGLSALVTFITGYGYASLLLGRHHWSIDADILFFMNHGCNQTYNFGDEYVPTTELNADPTCIPPEYDTSAEVYSPFIERHLRLVQCSKRGQ